MRENRGQRIISHQREAAMGFVVLGALMATLYAGERVTALLRKARVERRRAKSEYPITENDPVGRTIVF